MLNGGVGGIKLTLGRTKAKLRSLFIGWAEQSRKTLRQRNVQFDPTDSLFLSPCAPDGGLLLSRDFCPRLKHPNFSAPLFIVSLATTPPFLLTMGKLTSTIGIPIKLLNEAQVCFLSFIYAPSSCLHLVWETGANALRYRATSSPWKSPPESCIEENFSRVRRSTIAPGHHRLTRNSRGQHERSTEGYHGHCSGWSRVAFGSGLYSRKPREVLHCAGYVAVCSPTHLSLFHFAIPPPLSIVHLPIQKSNKPSNRNAPMFRSRGQRGRGVGLARGKATVQRARGQRRG